MKSITELRYDYAFTAAAMKYHDFMRLANHINEYNLYDDIKAIEPDEIMRRENKRTNKREFQEMIKRYENLTIDQKAIITEVDVQSQKHLILLAICKSYQIIKDFLVEVVRDKLMMMEYQLTDGQYNSFLNNKKEMYPELEDFSDSTEKKARQVLWRILEEAGIINSTKEKRIIPQFMSPQVVSVIKKDNPELLKIFLWSDAQIDAEI